jgi:polyisoprenoid-binding protein YceI
LAVSDGVKESESAIRAMPLNTIRRNLAATLGLMGLAVLLSASAAHRPPQGPTAAGAGEIILNVDPAQSSVHYSVSSSLHTVHGTFAVTRGSVQIDPSSGKAAGEIVVDAASGQSGNNSRDKKMHNEVLESARFTEIIFRPDRVEGALQPQGSSNTQLHGNFELHGSEHELSIPVQTELQSDKWKGTAHFGIPYTNWGLKNPSNFLLKVDHTVTVEVDLAGTIQYQSVAARP